MHYLCADTKQVRLYVLTHLNRRHTRKLGVVYVIFRARFRNTTFKINRDKALVKNLCLNVTFCWLTFLIRVWVRFLARLQTACITVFQKEFRRTVRQKIINTYFFYIVNSVHYRGADKSLARPGRKQARKHVRDARYFNNIETRAVIKFLFPASQGAEGNSRHSDRNVSLFPSWPG